MRVTPLLLASFFVIGCVDESSGPQEPVASPPTAPQTRPETPTVPTTPTSTDKVSLWGMIVSEGGGCIDGASIEVVRGQHAGLKIVQDPACDAWSYGGGFVFENLIPDMPMTVVVHARGFPQKEVTISPPREQRSAWVIVASRW